MSAVVRSLLAVPDKSARRQRGPGDGRWRVLIVMVKRRQMWSCGCVLSSLACACIEKKSHACTRAVLWWNTQSKACARIARVKSVKSTACILYAILFYRLALCTLNRPAQPPLYPWVCDTSVLVSREHVHRFTANSKDVCSLFLFSATITIAWLPLHRLLVQPRFVNVPWTAGTR